MAEHYYWNRANFEGLAALSSDLGSDLRLQGVAKYCELREKGLRRQAFAELSKFLDEVPCWDIIVQRELALRILEAQWKNPDVHQFLTEPLRKRFLERVLDEWCAAEPDNYVPVRNLALLRRDSELLNDAVRMNPKDQLVRVALAEILIGFVKFATHHLVEGRFIGDEVEAAAVLVKAAEVLENTSDSPSMRSLKEEVHYLTRLLADWKEYSEMPEASFPEWCRNRKRGYQWWHIVHYGGDA